MTIYSLKFLAFAGVVLAAYYRLSPRRQNLLLLAASYLFYATFSWHFVAILLFMTAANYLIGAQVGSRDNPRGWLAAGIAVNVAVLLFFKASDFFVPEAENLIFRIGGGTQTGGLRILLPVGLSFYVLQAISYLVDLSRRQIQAAADPIVFALYLAWFPKLTAGPIERARSFLPKLQEARTVDNEMLARSSSLLVLGLFRKIVIADTLLLAIPADLLRAPSSYSSFELLAWMGAYVFGLYNDFCGYTNIVRGVSGFFGIELSRNFIQPFFSRNFSELWTRWHITLSLWLRDYVYFPISRAIVRRSPGVRNPVNIILPPILTMLASGLWHGLRPGFVAWGGIMGGYLAVENFIASRRPVLPPDKRPMWKQIGGMVMVVTLASLSLVFFLMGPGGAVGFFSSFLTNPWGPLPGSRVFLLIVPAFLIDLAQHLRRDELPFLSLPLFPRAFLLAGVFLAIFAFSMSQHDTPFIYQGF